MWNELVIDAHEVEVIPNGIYQQVTMRNCRHQDLSATPSTFDLLIKALVHNHEKQFRSFINEFVDVESDPQLDINIYGMKRQYK